MKRRELLAGSTAATILGLVPGCDRIRITGADLDARIDPITPTEDFYIYACCGLPNIDRDTYRLVLESSAGELASLSAIDIEALPKSTKEHTLQCIGSNPRAQLINNCTWGGISLPDLLAELGLEVPETATHLQFAGADDYDAVVPISDLTLPIWLVWEQNEEPLTPEHGAPARLLVPGRYGIKNLKWLTAIRFLDSAEESWWTPFGWSEEGRVNANGFIASPPDGLRLESTDPVTVVGTANAGRDAVEKVEISVDGGPYQPATVDYTGQDIWTLWSFVWQPTDGKHTLKVRVTSAEGRVSVADPEGTDVFQGYDGSMEVTVDVRV